MRIIRLPGVFRPRSDTWILAEALADLRLGADARVADVCTGSGALAVRAALMGVSEVVAVDVSRRALLTCRLNARLNGVRVTALRGDLLAPLHGRRFDAIVSNPPYVPAESDELPRRGARRAWDAGLSGRLLLDRVLAAAPAHLAPGGSLLVVHSSICGVEETLRAMEAGGLDARVMTRRRGPLGPLLAARAPALEARGMLAPGVRHEDVVVVRGTQPLGDRSPFPPVVAR